MATTLHNILNSTFVNKQTPESIRLKVKLQKTKVKGIGIFAVEEIGTNEVIALYRFQVFRETTYKSPTHNNYCFAAYTKGGHESKIWIGDLVPTSLQPPILSDDKTYFIPFWAYFSNEPAPSQFSNAWIDMNTEENYKHRKRLKEGDYLVYKLVAMQPIAIGEEVVWFYGKEYGVRDYPI